MIVSESIGNVKDLRLIYEGSGDPKDPHTIIGVKFAIPGVKFTVNEECLEGYTTICTPGYGDKVTVPEKYV